MPTKYHQSRPLTVGNAHPTPAKSLLLNFRIDIVNTLMYVNSMLIVYEFQGIQVD